MKNALSILKETITIVAISLYSMTVLAAPNNSHRIVSAGSGVTEIIYALGAGDQVVAVDSNSAYPNAVHKLPKLGYHKNMSAEGILALNPSIMIGTDDMGPSATIAQLKDAGLTVMPLFIENSTENIQQRIETLATLLKREHQGQQLWKTISKDLVAAKALSGQHKKPKVLFMLAMGGRVPSVSGSDTAANTLIELAGGINPAAEQYSSYKPLSNEALLMMSPDFVIYADDGNGMTDEQFIAMQPILKQTPAGKKGHLIAIDPGLLLGGLGPRTGEQALKLAKAFFPSE
ncbi:hypothetical protein ACH42_06025 [Endozoicomonas sp. (ex Bugula neritina AB1)]|nr:hypothetical protein ACH42_06025 [Endozoicomonas sp. (ex Bugula neritina AB1)]